MIVLMPRPIPLEHDSLLGALLDSVSDRGWVTRLSRCLRDGGGTLHVAVMREPYLTLLLEGRKTIESRFSVNRVCPFGAVDAGDVLALKAQSGPLVGLALVEHAAFYELDPATLAEIRREFTSRICADGAFWQARANARYGSLLRVAAPLRIQPLRLLKRDRRGWVRITRAPLQLAMPA
jgi:hypothetical protein